MNELALSGKAFRVSEDANKKVAENGVASTNLSREERLAAKLRENLRRRKAQSRTQASDSEQSGVPKDDGQS